MSEVANVTCPNGKTVQESKYDVYKNSNYNQRFQQKRLNGNYYSSNPQQQKKKLIELVNKLLLLQQNKVNLAKKSSKKIAVTIKNMTASQNINSQQCSLQVINKTQAVTIKKKQNQKLMHQATYYQKKKNDLVVLDSFNKKEIVTQNRKESELLLAGLKLLTFIIKPF